MIATEVRSPMVVMVPVRYEPDRALTVHRVLLDREPGMVVIEGKWTDGVGNLLAGRYPSTVEWCVNPDREIRVAS
jgi:hypothetical protein